MYIDRVLQGAARWSRLISLTAPIIAIDAIPI